MAGQKRKSFLNKGLFDFSNSHFFKKVNTSKTLVFGGMFLFGLFLVALSFIINYKNSTKLSFSGAVDESMSRQIGTTPAKIFIPKVKIELPMLKTRIANKTWEIQPDGVSFLTYQNTIIAYAHNKKDRFGFLKKVKIGDSVYLQLQNGNMSRFEIYSIKIVSPSEVSALVLSIPSAITLYTCTGFADSKRLVVSAKPITEFSSNNNL